MTSQHEIPALVLGTCINSLGVIRALGRNGVPVIAVTEQADSPGAHSRYVKRLWAYEGGEDALVDLLLERSGQFPERPVVFPITDRVVLRLAARREELAKRYRLPLPEEDLVRSAMGKRGFSAWARELDLPVPRTEFVSNERQLRAAAERMTYPCVAKPDFQTPAQARSVHLKVRRIETASELIDFYARTSTVEPNLVIQEWIPGGDDGVHYCLTYFARGSRPLASFSGRKIRQWPPLAGSACSVEPIVCPEMEDLTRRFFVGIRYHGLGSLECKRSAADGRLLLVEATIGRTDFFSDVANVNGVPIPYIAYRDLVGLEPIRPHRRRRGVKWVRWSADRAAAEHYRREGTLTRADWLGSIRPPVAWSTWAADDPLPYLASLGGRLRARAARLTRRLAPAGKGNGTP